MKTIRWNEEKNERLKRERGIDLESIAMSIKRDEVMRYENKRGQTCVMVVLDGYPCVAPIVESEHEIFLKTAWFSRKWKKKVKEKKHAP